MSLEQENVAAQFDFRLGPNYVDPPWLLRPGECASTVNLWWDDDGLRVVPPAAVAVQTQWTSGTALGLFVDWRDGVVHPFVATTAGQILRWTGSTWAVEQSGLSTTARMRAAKMAPYVLFANGADFVRAWDGMNWSTLDQAPRFAHLAVAVGNDYMFGAGHSPTQIRYSELADPTVWPTGNVLDVALDERWGTITGLVRWGERVYAFTPGSIWAIGGSGPESFELERTLSDLGSASPDSIVVTDIGVAFWAPTGPAIFNGVRSFTLSRRVRPLAEQLDAASVIAGYDPGKRLVVFLAPDPRVPGSPPCVGFLVDLRELAGTRAVNVDETLGAPCWPIWTAWDASFGLTAFSPGPRSGADARPVLWLATSSRRLMHWRLGFSNDIGATRLVSSAGWPEDPGTYVGLAGLRTGAFMPKDPTRVMRIRHVDVWTRPTIDRSYCPAPVLRVGLRRMGELLGRAVPYFRNIGEVSNVADQEGPYFERFTGDGSAAYEFARWVQVEVTHDAGAAPGEDAPATAVVHGVAVGWEPTARRGVEPRVTCQAQPTCPAIGAVGVTSSTYPNRVQEWFFPIYIPRAAGPALQNRLYSPVEGSQRLAWCDLNNAQTWYVGSQDLLDLSVYYAIDQTQYMGVFVPPNQIHMTGLLRRRSDGQNNSWYRVATLGANDYALGPLVVVDPDSWHVHNVGYSWFDRDPTTGRMAIVILRHPDTAYLPTRLALSDDGGATWTVSSIPNEYPGPSNARRRVVVIDGLIVVIAPVWENLEVRCFIHYSPDGTNWSRLDVYPQGGVMAGDPSGRWWNIVRDSFGRVWWQLYRHYGSDPELIVRQLTRSGNRVVVGPEERSGVRRGPTSQNNGWGHIGTAVAGGRMIFQTAGYDQASGRNIRATRFPDGHWSTEYWTSTRVHYFMLGCRETDDVCGRSYAIAGEGPGAGVQRTIFETRGALS